MILNYWFGIHINSPRATKENLRFLSKLTNLTENQILDWIKRTRKKVSKM
jgi:hypothetical protein